MTITKTALSLLEHDPFRIAIVEMEMREMEVSLIPYKMIIL